MLLLLLLLLPVTSCCCAGCGLRQRAWQLAPIISAWYNYKLECGPMPNVMAALPNIGGALCSPPQSLSDAHYRVPCSNAGKTRNQLKFAGVSKTRQQISAISGPKFTILHRHVGRYCCLTSFFPIVDMFLTYEDISRQSCAIVLRWRFFASCISSEPRGTHFKHAF